MATVARAWCRVDLCGGTLDIWPLGLLHPGARTINVAVDLAATVRLERAASGYRVSQDGRTAAAAAAAQLEAEPETALAGVVAGALGLPPFAAELASDSPRGGGLGASSAMAVALIAAAEEEFDLPRSAPAARAHLARDLEARLMRLPTGTQDHYAALLGGALEIVPLPGGERVRHLAADLEALAASLLVVYSGISHFSAGQNWQAIRRCLDGEPEATALLAGIAEGSAELPAALEAGDLPRVGKLMSAEWRHRRKLAEGISTPALETLVAAAAAGGAWGGKPCGAGGGGCLAFLCPPAKKTSIASHLTAAGGTIIHARPQHLPLQVKLD